MVLSASRCFGLSRSRPLLGVLGCHGLDAAVFSEAKQQGKWKGLGRCYKQMEGTWAVLQANGRGLGCYKQMEGPGRCYEQMEGAWA